MGINDSTQCRIHVCAQSGPLMFYCPGCRELHGVWLPQKPNDLTGAAWTWNGDTVSPTFSPSIDVRANGPAPRCHSHVINGTIHYGSDCGHSMAGMVVPLPFDPLNF